MELKKDEFQWFTENMVKIITIRVSPQLVFHHCGQQINSCLNTPNPGLHCVLLTFLHKAHSCNLHSYTYIHTCIELYTYAWPKEGPRSLLQHVTIERAI